jgi:uncharacterized protein YdeI (BOF family)
MKRIISVLALTALMAAMLLAMAMPAFAVQGGFASDDKNNPTFPGTGQGNNPQPSGQAITNTDENCFKHILDGDVPGDGLPAQCY